MAKRWWQFKHWPGEHPDVDDVVEEWVAGEPPNDCTVCRASWLNQFIGWSRYVSLEPLDSTYGAIDVRHNIQPADFWNLRCRPSFNLSGGYAVRTFATGDYTPGGTFAQSELVPGYDSIAPGDIIHPGAPGDRLIDFLCKARAEIDKIGSVDLGWLQLSDGRIYHFRHRWENWGEGGGQGDAPYGNYEQLLELDIGGLTSSDPGFDNYYLAGIDLTSDQISEVRGQRLAVVSLKANISGASPDSEAPSEFPMPSNMGLCHAILDVPAGASSVSWTCNAGKVETLQPWSGNSYWNWYRRPALVLVIKDSLPAAYRRGWPEGTEDY